MNGAVLLLAAASALPGGYDGELIDFTASWCGPCQQMSPIVSRLHREGLPVRKVDVDRNGSLARQYGVKNIPAFVLVVNGNVVDRVVGVTSESRLRSMIARIPKSEPPVATPTVSNGPAARRVPVTPVSVPAPSGSSLGMPAEFPGVARANNDIRHREVPPVVSRTANRPLGASVRIRVVDESGVNFGSATIVESRPGRAILLSCGHVFRELDEDSRIEVDVFDRDEKGRITDRSTFVGTIVGYDMKADVSLLSIPAERRLPVCPIVSAADRAAVGDTVTTIGCGGGQLPSVQTQKVTRLNRYLGPDNLECTGVPIQGRSGGGLFDTNGRVVGVCIAADPRDKEGIYAGPNAIYTLLERYDLQRVVEGATETGSPAAAVAAADTDSPNEIEFEDDLGTPAEPASVTDEATTPNRRAREAVSPPERIADLDATQLPDDVAELLDNAGDAEVICIIRRHDEPRSQSRIVVINRASSKFVSYLGGELKEQPRLTSDRRETPQTSGVSSMQNRLEGSGWRILRRPVTKPRAEADPVCKPGPSRYRRSR